MSGKKIQTALSKYKSPSTGDFCTSAQYVAELICQKLAKHEKVGTLPYKFWNLPKWKKIYIRQVSLANKLIKEYGEEPVIKFVKSSAGKNTISLGARNVKKEIEKIKFALDNTPKRDTIEIIAIEPLEFKPRKSFGTKTLVNRLKDIESDMNNNG
jgi:hypothetical protein